MKKRERILFYGIFAILIIVLSFFDQPIMQTLYDPTNHYGRFLAAIGEMPFLWLAAFGGWIAFKCRDKKTKKASISWGITYGVLAFLASLYAGVMLYIYLGQLGYYDYSKGVRECWWLVIIITAVVCLTAFGVAQVIKVQDREKALSWGLMVVILWVCYLVTMVVFKFLWYRPRYRYLVTEEAIKNGDKFLPWWHPNCHGRFDDHFASFPSGHTMNAAGVIVLASASSVFSFKENKKWFFYALAIVWTSMVAMSRTVQGAHYSTDVCFGYFFGILDYDLLMTFGYPKILEKTKKRLE